MGSPALAPDAQRAHLVRPAHRLPPLPPTPAPSLPRCPAVLLCSRLPLSSCPFGDDKGRRPLTDGFLGDDDLSDIFPVGEIVHDVGHHGFEDRPESAGSGAALERTLGDGSKRFGIERQTYVLQ